VSVGIILPVAAETEGRIAVEPVIGRLEVRMLARKDQGRRQPALGEGRCDGFKLDGFGTSPDDERYATGQLSP
jgi:hypothetical protein